MHTAPASDGERCEGRATRASGPGAPAPTSSNGRIKRPEGKSDQLSTASKPKEKAASQRVKLSNIVQDRKLWPRQNTDQERVKEFAALYKEEPKEDILPPLIVAIHPTKPGKYLLVDGWHRAEAIKMVYPGRDVELDADVLPKGTDAYAEAVRLSAISSKPLTILEKRAVVRRLLDEHKDWSDRQIARMAGVSNVFVSSQHKTLTRLAGEAKDMVKKALEPSPGATRSAPGREEPTINQLLWRVIADVRADQINLNTWRNWAGQYPQYKPVMRHVATVLFQASQDTAPTAPDVNANTRGQESAARRP